MEWLRRIGFAGKGSLYATLGALVVISAVASRTRSMGFRQTLKWLSEQSFGMILVGVVGIGLTCYSVYRLACALANCENEGDDHIGIGKRIGFGASGVAYASLAVFAATLVIYGSGAGDSRGDLIAELSASPWGKLALWVVAAGLAVAAMSQFYLAWSGQYREDFDWSELPPESRRFVTLSAIFGITARAIAFLLFAFFVAIAATGSGSGSGVGLDRALSWIHTNSGSSTVVATFAAGFIGYGVYAFAIAWCGRKS